jgi:hypothetical protein
MTVEQQQVINERRGFLQGRSDGSGAQLTPVIPSTQEAEMRRTTVQGQPMGVQGQPMGKS